MRYKGLFMAAILAVTAAFALVPDPVVAQEGGMAGESYKGAWPAPDPNADPVCSAFIKKLKRPFGPYISCCNVGDLVKARVRYSVIPGLTTSRETWFAQKPGETEVQIPDRVIVPERSACGQALIFENTLGKVVCFARPKADF